MYFLYNLYPQGMPGSNVQLYEYFYIFSTIEGKSIVINVKVGSAADEVIEFITEYYCWGTPCG